MAKEVVSAFAERLQSYAKVQRLKRINILFHGGEPLLRTPDFYDETVKTINTMLMGTSEVAYALQTNGFFLNPQWMDCFERNDISVSVSIDGPEIAQNLHRRLADGASSFKKVHDAVQGFLNYPTGRRLLKGVLAVVDLRNDPEAVFDFHRDTGIPNIDYLWPDGNYDRLPPGLCNTQSDKEYAEWLSVVFDKWFSDGLGVPSIRLFENIMALMFGGQSGSEGLGPGELSLLTIHTDGEIQDTDVMSIAFNNAGRFGNGFNVRRDSFEELFCSGDFEHQRRLHTKETLSMDCRVCPWGDICGGGLLPHRYSSRCGFNAPSIYCGNLRHLFTHIHDKVMRALEMSKTRQELDTKVPVYPHGHPQNVASSESNSNFSLQKQSTDCMEFKEFMRAALGLDVESAPDHRGSGIIFNARTLTELHWLFSVIGNIARVWNATASLSALCEMRVKCVESESCAGEGLLLSLHAAAEEPCRDYTTPWHVISGLVKALLSPRGPSLVTHGPPLAHYRWDQYLAMNRMVSRFRIATTEDGSGKANLAAAEARKLFCNVRISKIETAGLSLFVEHYGSLYANESSLVEVQASSARAVLVVNHAWALFAWMKHLEYYPQFGRSLVITHLDAHDDMMSPLLLSCSEESRFTDAISGYGGDLTKAGDLAHFIETTAIGPGAFIVPFLSLFQCAEMVHVNADRPEGAPVELRRGRISNHERLGSKLNHNVPAFVDARGGGIFWRTTSHLPREYPMPDPFWVLNIDADYFSNEYNGAGVEQPMTNSAQNIRNAERRLAEVLVWLGEAPRAPDIITLALSPDFCRFEVGVRVISTILSKLRTLGWDCLRGR